LRGLATVISAANRHHVPISICGEMAHQERYLAFLIGIGCRTLSVDPHWIPVLHRALATIDTQEAETHSARVLAASVIEDVAKLLPQDKAR
jgi:phosphoenolpyruvate-protein kinase (PTS system EI component)